MLENSDSEGWVTVDDGDGEHSDFDDAKVITVNTYNDLNYRYHPKDRKRVSVMPQR